MILRAMLVAMLGLLMAGSPTTAAELRAGAGRAEIRIPADLLPIQGFGVLRDALQARVLVLETGGRRTGLAVVDLTSISDDEVAVMKAIVAQAARAEAADVVIVASHTFSAPHIMPAGRPFPGFETAAEQSRNATFKTAVETALRDAASQAAMALRPARLGFGRGVANVSVNRDQHTPEGFWLGVDSAGNSDKDLAVIRIEDLDHQPLAILANYAVQPSVMDQAIVEGGAKAITGDLTGAAMRRVETLYGDGLVSFFLIGAAGDQAPLFKARRAVADKAGRQTTVDIGAQGYLLVDLLGERLAQDVIRVSEHVRMPDQPGQITVTRSATPLQAQQRPKSLQDLRPAKTYAFTPAGDTSASFVVLRLGDVVVVGVQVELSSITGQQIKQRSPFPNTIVTTMVDGAAKYMPDEGGYERITYEAMNSSYSRGSAEALVNAILEAIGPR